MFCSQFYINLDPIPWNNNKIKHYKKFNKKKFLGQETKIRSVKYRIFHFFSGMEILWERAVSTPGN